MILCAVMRVGMAVVVQMFLFRRQPVFAAVAFEQAAFGHFMPSGLGIEQVEDALIETKVRAQGKGYLRVLALQAHQLRLDALDQHAGKEIHRDDANLLHAEADLALHDGFQARPGDAGEGQIDQVVVAVFKQPARHFRQFAIGPAIRRAAAEQDDAGGARVGHVQVFHQAVKLALEHGEYLAAHAEVAHAVKAHAGMAQAGGVERGRQFHLDVPGSIENEGQGDDPARIARGTVEPFVKQHFSMFDEANLDPPFRVALAPLCGKMQDFLVAFAVARAVADEEKTGVVHDEEPSVIDARRKR